jgi:hypothetical protein
MFIDLVWNRTCYLPAYSMVQGDMEVKWRVEHREDERKWRVSGHKVG